MSLWERLTDLENMHVMSVKTTVISFFVSKAFVHYEFVSYKQKWLNHICRMEDIRSPKHGLTL
jgi:hypothetical protein